MRMTTLAGLLLPTILLLVGCQNKMTRENFQMIRVGVDQKEDVFQILGPPDADFDDQWLYDDVDRFKSAIIYFDEAGQVAGKEWMDAEAGTFEGRNPNTNEPPEGEVRESETNTRRYDD